MYNICSQSRSILQYLIEFFIQYQNEELNNQMAIITHRMKSNTTKQPIFQNYNHHEMTHLKKIPKLNPCVNIIKNNKKKHQYILNMNKNTSILLIFSFFFTSTILSIGVPLHNGTRCMILQGEYDPIKLEVKLPQIPNKQEGQKFRVTLVDYLEAQNVFQIDLDQKIIYRKNLQLPYNKMFQLCMQFLSDRQLKLENETMYAQFRADEDFDSLIGTFAVPPELVGEQNLQYIYNISESISRINKKVIQNQQKEREVEDGMAMSNLHKNERITMFTIIECVIIVLSGVYQVFALRRFLIQKNLY